MNKLLLAGLLLALPTVAQAAVKTQPVTYQYEGTTLKGFLAYDDASKEKRPGVLIVHEWWGLDDYARKRAEQLAGLGYVAFALDMYGEGKTTEHPKEAGAMAGEVRKNVKTWQGRALAGLKVLQDHELTDAKRIAAIGYCFGGSTVLQLAHAGAPVQAVVSFHGALPVPDDDQAKAAKAKVMICHGAADSFIDEETIKKVRAAYEKAGVDYQLIYYGGAQHSFTVPDADKRGINGIKYNAAADRRSWADMRGLFDEVFGKTKELRLGPPLRHAAEWRTPRHVPLAKNATSGFPFPSNLFARRIIGPWRRITSGFSLETTLAHRHDKFFSRSPTITAQVTRSS